VVTALLSHALEQGLIDGAVVARWNPKAPTQGMPFIARTQADLLSAVGSKYTPVPMGQSLSTIVKAEGRYAVVGLPCQIAAFRSAALRLESVRERIRFYIGLFCDTLVKEEGLDFWFYT